MNQEGKRKDKHIEIHDLFNFGNSRYEKKDMVISMKASIGKVSSY